jgi:diacylglycerol kinase family enzyme
MTCPHALPLIYNPLSGRSGLDPDALLARLPPELRERLAPVRLEPPFDFAPSIAQARAAGGPLLVWGGDGTLHHAGRALVDQGCPVPLGAIPGGSGNGLARGLRTPLDPAGAVLRLLEGRDLAVDLPRLDGAPFLNLCGTGFEAAVAEVFDIAKGRGFRTYAEASLRIWRRHREVGLEWEAVPAPDPPPAGRMDRLRAAWRGPRPALPRTAWSLCFANLPQYGSGLWIAPDADPVDGILEWVRLSRPGAWDLVTQVPQLFREGGRCHLRQTGRFLRAVVRLDRELPWHMDGEPQPPRDRAELSLDRRAFPMRVTPGCPWR